MNFTETKQFVVEKLLEWKLQAWSLVIIAMIASAIRLVEQHLVKLIPNPKELWAVRSIELNLVLLFVMVGLYLLYRNKHILPRPNLSKKTEIQDQILTALKTEPMPSWIAKQLGCEEQFVIYNLEILGKDILVARNGLGSSSWYLTKHGRVYLYGKP